MKFYPTIFKENKGETRKPPRPPPPPGPYGTEKNVVLRGLGIPMPYTIPDIQLAVFYLLTY